MLVPGFPGITFKDIFHRKQSSDSLPFPLNSKYRNIEIPAPHRSEASDAGSKTYFYFFARNGIYHGLRNFGIKPGDEVLMPELNSTIEPQVVRHLGAIPIFYKIKTFKPSNLQTFKPFDDFTPDWDDVRSKFTSKTKFFHLIHYLGVPNDLDAALEFCENNKLIFFEDAAYGFLSTSRHLDISKSPLGSFGDFGILCPRKTIPVPNGGILVINHHENNRYTNNQCSDKNDNQLLHRCIATSVHSSLQASYSSAWDWQFLLRNNPKEVASERVSKFERKRPVTTPHLHTFTPSHLQTKSLFKRLLKDPFYVFHGSGKFNLTHASWGMTRLAHNQLFKFDYPTIIKNNLENYSYVRDYCVNRGWDIFPREIKPGTIPNAILLRITNNELRITDRSLIPDSKFLIRNEHSKSKTTENHADIISGFMLRNGVQLARPWHWNENITTLKNIPPVDAYVGRGLVLPIHYQLSRNHLDYYLSLLSNLLSH